LIELIAAYGSPAACAADPEGARRLLRKVSRGAVKEDRAALLLAQASESLGQPMIDRELRLMRCIAAELLRCRQQVSRLEHEIEELCGANELLDHLRGAVGPKTAAVVLAALGDPRQYARPRSYLKALGLALKEKSSGTIKGKLSISKRGPGRCRWYLYLAVLRWIQNDPIAKAWYEAKVARDGGRLKGKAVVALMRKLVKALWHVARGARLESRKLFDLGKLGISQPA
jgi:transposase